MYHEAKQAKGTSNKDKNHLLKKWAERDVEKPALHHQRPSSEKNACHKSVNNKTLVKRKDNLCIIRKENLHLRRILWLMPRAQKSSAPLMKATLMHLTLLTRLLRFVHDFWCLW